MPNINYYQVLGVERTATTEQIKASYKKQCLSLHPDKNPFGAEMMKLVNEAKACLCDERKRRAYNRELDNPSTNNNNDYRPRGFGGGDNSAEVNNLRRQLAESQRKQSILKQENKSLRKKVSNLQDQAVDVQEQLVTSNSLYLEKNRQVKELKHKQKRLDNEVKFHKQQSKLLENEKNDQHKQITKYEEKIEKAVRNLREERRKSDGLVIEKEKAEETIKKLSERSVCYRCNGQAVCENDCDVCFGSGAIEGEWTRCHMCDGKGEYTSLNGEKISCELCSGKGAKEGCHDMTCFKCKGMNNKKGFLFGGNCNVNCSVCYGGRIRGFNLMLCPLCEGKGECENCFGNGFVSCKCGLSCKGHSPNKLVKPSFSFKEGLHKLLLNEKKPDWEAKFLSRWNESPFDKVKVAKD